MQILAVTSEFLLRGHKMFNFLVSFFLKISENLKAHISGTETDISTNGKKLSSWFLTVFHFRQ